MLGLVFFISSCCKEDTLPLETQEGKNTFGCLVNGELWLKGGAFSFPVPNMGVYVTKNNVGITASRFGDHLFQSISMDVNAPINIGTYRLNSYNRLAKFIDEETKCKYQTDSISASGILETTRLDTIKKILSGRFNFVALKYNTDDRTSIFKCDSLIKVTEGRFDLKYY